MGVLGSMLKRVKTTLRPRTLPKSVYEEAYLQLSRIGSEQRARGFNDAVIWGVLGAKHPL